ncbi:hypothetical protein LCGC14_2498930 [marine sediment metagenome]|uniref:Holin of 3TMs, for gene-transfer release n=1 Tax=marine sediment metagenome TaxID=412755 RepID=A0A0F9BQH0_9ZZZZ
MSIFKKLLGAVGSVFPPAALAKKVIDVIGGGDDSGQVAVMDLEPAIAQAVLERDAARDNAMAETLQSELESRARIIEAEMGQGDTYTKRARPSVVYSGLLMFFLEFGIRAWLVMSGQPMPEGTIMPGALIAGWTTVTGVWAVGRSAEKIAKTRNGGNGSSMSPLLKAIVG